MPDCVIRTNYSATQALCHCLDCKKMSGSAYSTNVVAPGEGFKVTSGKPKTWTKKADSGVDVTTSFCGDCGTNMWRETPTFGDLNDAKPDVELYAPQRASWSPALPGAIQ